MELVHAKRIVIKIGSALLVSKENGALRSEWLKTLAEDIADLRKSGKEVIIVTSGAVALGRKHIEGNGTFKALRLEEKQAAAACGQVELMQDYQKYLSHHNLKAAQLLLTIDDSENRRRYLNARATIDTLLDKGIIPIINENDTVATMELRFGDNDRLAARVAQMAEADVLVLLSDIDGLYTANPHVDEDAKHISVVEVITPKIEGMAGGSASRVGTGGMVTKIMAAKIAVGAGCYMVITRGEVEHPIKALEQGARCTWFVPHATPQGARKHWIASTLLPTGVLVVDAGAAKALSQGNSLLPAGVTNVKGSFQRGDAVLIQDVSGKELGKGLSAYSSEDALKIIGHKSTEIEGILGFTGRQELIHRDNLVIFN
ncbi:MAG: Glutamate 5-kinase [Rickettsiales bacterium]|jgi:glutamate 5-kinase|nr:Glutamate 5-kinase [Rickettsiales bacterium]